MMSEMVQNINDIFRSIKEENHALRQDMKKENHVLRQDMAQMWRKLDQFQQINYQAHSSSNTMPTVQRPPGYRLPNTETTHNYRQPFPQHQGEEAYESSPEPQLPPSQDYQITTRIQQNKAFKQALSSTTSKFNGSDAQEYVEWKRSFQLETSDLKLNSTQML